MNKNKQKEFLVVGATGKTGKRVFERLTKLGLNVRGASTSSNPKFDWNDSSTWNAVVKNIDAAYVSFYPDVAVPGAVETIQQFAKIAVKAGVKKLVLLSGRGEIEAQQCEDVIINAGADWVIVRSSWFCQNFSEGIFLEQVSAGYVTLPASDIGEPFIDVDDIADVAVASLTDDKHNGQIYEVTGSRLITFREAIKEIAKETGKDIKYEQVPMGAYAEALREYHVPNDLISLITYLFSEVLDGRNAILTDGVQRAIGRKPTDFSEFVRKTAATGVWS